MRKYYLTLPILILLLTLAALPNPQRTLLSGQQDEFELGESEATKARVQLEHEAAVNEMSIVRFKKQVEFWGEMLELNQKIKIAGENGKLAEAARIESGRGELVEQFERQQFEMELQLSLQELLGMQKVAEIEKDELRGKRAAEAAQITRLLLTAIQQLHKAFDADDELKIEHNGARADILEGIREALFMRLELSDELTKTQHKLVDQYEAAGKKLLVAVDQFHKLEATGVEKGLDAAEAEMVELLEQFEPWSERLPLVRELIEARENEDEEAIEEIEREIEGLQNLDEPRTEVIPDDEATNTTEQATAVANFALTADDLAKAKDLDLEKDVAPLMKKYCFECHGNDTSEGDLNIQQLITKTPLVSSKRRWINVIEQTKNHVMPPSDADQPSSVERKMVVGWLHNAIHQFDYSEVDDPGFEVTRRLSHHEYNNTIRDLFGIDIRPADRFPEDLSATSGFDNSGNSLFIQPLLMERYIGAAEFVVDQAFPDAASTKEHERAAKLIFVKRPNENTSEAEAANAVLKRFLLRAYRRPATREEHVRLVKQFDGLRLKGHSFESAIKLTIKGILISPKFLMRVELVPPTESLFAVNDWELANRLSYFLWASMPDDELMTLAVQKKLSDNEVLTDQVTRMIADEKSRSLGTTFAGQWLGFRHLGSRHRADPIDNPWCTETLMSAMKSESSMFFNSLIRENKSLPRLIDAKYTFMNEELAKHYRISGVRGAEMRRVELDDERRGGIVTHGSLLAVTSFPGRTSPVVRGKWVLETILGTPPPPPPPNVSELSERIERSRNLTQKQKLELHRQKPNCNACHSQIDPLGFSLENYDWFGRWRSKGRAEVEGQLPNGTTFGGPSGLKRVLVEQRMDDLRRQVTEKMLTYALGRQLEYFDEPAVRSILAEVASDDDRFQTIIASIVRSYPFRFKKLRVAESH